MASKYNLLNIFEFVIYFSTILFLEVLKMPKNNPIEFTGKVLNQRNQLTGPDDPGKNGYPERPKNVSIQDSNEKGNQ
jgi:hypothetical protein